MARLKGLYTVSSQSVLSNHELKEPPCKAAFYLANTTLDLRGSSIIPLDPLVFDDHYPRIGNTGFTLIGVLPPVKTR